MEHPGLGKQTCLVSVGTLPKAKEPGWSRNGAALANLILPQRSQIIKLKFADAASFVLFHLVFLRQFPAVAQAGLKLTAIPPPLTHIHWHCNFESLWWFE